ncbi:hypothetical protein ACPW6J_003716 [Enterobacter hormaechei]
MLIKKILNVGIIVSLTVAGVNLYRYLQNRDDGKSILSCSLPTGNFEIIPRDGRLNAVNTESGMTLGVPERRPDGSVLLVTNGGRVRDVTECLGEKKGWFTPRWPGAADR